MTTTDPRSFTVKVPISVTMGVRKKRKYFLNLNLFRNNTHHQNNNIKKEFKRVVGPLLPDVYFERFSLEYQLFLPNKFKRDVANVLSIVDKNFCDALVELGRAPDDNYQHLQDIWYRYGGYDDEGVGYVLVTVREKSAEDLIEI